MNSMFESCTALKTLDLSSFDFSKVTSSTKIFDSVSTSIVITVNDTTAETWVRAKLGDEKGTIIVLNPDTETDENESETTEETTSE